MTKAAVKGAVTTSQMSTRCFMYVNLVQSLRPDEVDDGIIYAHVTNDKVESQSLNKCM